MASEVEKELISQLSRVMESGGNFFSTKTFTKELQSGFVNESGKKFRPLCEAYRTYETPAFSLRIEKPRWIHISESGGHRIVCQDGTCYYVKPGWGETSYYIVWEPEEGKPHFTF